MSRSGYVDDYDCESWGLWRGAVGRACRGKRGQAFFASLVEALDALPEKRLIAGDLQNANGCCAMGAIAQNKGIAVDEVDIHDRDQVADLFDIAPALAAETAYVNDDEGPGNETPEQRFVRIRAWAVANIHAGKET